MQIVEKGNVEIENISISIYKFILSRYTFYNKRDVHDFIEQFMDSFLHAMCIYNSLSLFLSLFDRLIKQI